MAETASNAQVVKMTALLCEVIASKSEGFVGAVVGLPGCASQNTSEEELLKDLAAIYKDFMELGAEWAKEPTLNWWPESKLVWLQVA